MLRKILWVVYCGMFCGIKCNVFYILYHSPTEILQNQTAVKLEDFKWKAHS